MPLRSWVGHSALWNSAVESRGCHSCCFALAALLGAVLLIRLRRSPWPVVIALAFILGVARVAVSDDALPHTYASLQSQQVEGLVLSDVEALGNFARFRLDLERIRREGGDWTVAEETLLVTARANVELAEMRDAPYFRYGDRLLIEGIIEEPPELEAFDYAAYLARQGIAEVLNAAQRRACRRGRGQPVLSFAVRLQARACRIYRCCRSGATGRGGPGDAAGTSAQYPGRPDGGVPADGHGAPAGNIGVARGHTAEYKPLSECCDAGQEASPPPDSATTRHLAVRTAVRDVPIRDESMHQWAACTLCRLRSAGSAARSRLSVVPRQ